MSSLNDSVSRNVLVYKFLVEQDRFLSSIKHRSSIERSLGWAGSLFVGTVAWVIGVLVILATAPAESIAATPLGSILVGLTVGLLGGLGGYYFGVKVLYPLWWKEQLASFPRVLNEGSYVKVAAKSISLMLDEAQAKDVSNFKLLISERKLGESFRNIVDKVNSVLSTFNSLPLSDDQKAGVRKIVGELDDLSEMWLKVSTVSDSDFEALMVQAFEFLLQELTVLQDEFLLTAKTVLEEKLETFNATYGRASIF